MLRADRASAHYPVDPDRLDLVEEFRRAPRGPHGEELQKLVHRLRWAAEKPRYVLIVDETGRSWRIGRLPERTGGPVTVHGQTEFRSPEDAEWEVFRLRWEAATGRKIPGGNPA
ncbi:hypothetical protein [Mesorhizobium sp. ES1-6]|uniref:hypothetical protein n=1 Tax=Mesorhizobium sp. ES1-6 TaxID=2876626 RepID=UPI001CCDBC2A|nr:hypothetical protein [Mesorhizobium sp. ES1-6]MBZ9801156.1 hypothetical protein [Mesorhizobium sp. ES1-6]